MSSANGSSVRSWSAVGSPVSQRVMAASSRGAAATDGRPVRWVVVVPVKPAADGKTRLAGVLSASARERAGPGDGARHDRGGRRDARGGPGRRGDGGRAAADAAGDVRRPRRRARRRAERRGPRGDRPGVATATRRSPSCSATCPRCGPTTSRTRSSMAAAHERAFVADADGTGTTLLAALPGVALDPRFGSGSAAAHELAGHVRLGGRRHVDRASRRRRPGRPGRGGSGSASAPRRARCSSVGACASSVAPAARTWPSSSPWPATAAAWSWACTRRR